MPGLRRFYMDKITVDEVSGENYTPFPNLLFSIKECDDNWDSPYTFENDGYPIDEEFYFKTGYVYSTNPAHEEFKEEYLRMFFGRK